MLGCCSRVSPFHDMICCRYCLRTRWNRLIGLHDSAREHDFRWLSGAPLYYQKWSKNEPNGNTVQNCVFMNGKPELVDTRCDWVTAASLCSTLGRYRVGHGYRSYTVNSKLSLNSKFVSRVVCMITIIFRLKYDVKRNSTKFKAKWCR